MDLTEFLAARLDEDQAEAHLAITEIDPEGEWAVSEWTGGVNHFVLTRSGAMAAAAQVGTAPHIARHDPARALREIEAGRKLLAWYADSVDAAKLFREKLGTGTHMATAAESYLNAIRAAAAVYRDHPDYDPLWAPPE